MISLGKRKWVHGIVDPHVDELMARLDRAYEHRRCTDKDKRGIDLHMRYFELSDLAIIVIHNVLQLIQYWL